MQLPNYSIFYNIDTKVDMVFKLASYSSFFSCEIKMNKLEEKVAFCEQSCQLNRKYLKILIKKNRNIVQLAPINESSCI